MSLHSLRDADDLDKGLQFDVMTTTGFLVAARNVLRVIPGGVLHGGVPCSSWVFLSRGSSKRSKQFPQGDTGRTHVLKANLITTRFALLVLVALARSVYWCVEQPLSSLMPAYLPMTHVMTMTADYVGLCYSSFAMGMYGAFSLKPTQLWGSLSGPQDIVAFWGQDSSFMNAEFTHALTWAAQW